jgi:S1-C subfamily serine protease
MRHILCVLAVAAALGLAGRAAAQPAAGQPAAGPGPYLGVMIGPDGDTALIREVAPGSPAEKAGIKAGDRVAKVGTQEVKDVEAFLKAVAAHKPGDKVALTVERDGKEQTLTATLGERPAAAAGPGGPVPGAAPGVAFLGVQLQPLTPELRTRLKVDADAGAVIGDVVPGSPAEKAGLKRDDVVTAAASKPVRSPADLREAIQQTGAGRDLGLAVSRGGEKVTLTARPQAESVGQFVTPGTEPFPSVEAGSMLDQGRRIRELERRVAELEQRVRELDRKPGPPK